MQAKRSMAEGASDSEPGFYWKNSLRLTPLPPSSPCGSDGPPSPLSRGRMDFSYFSDSASPLKSRLTIRPACSPVSVSTAPFWFASTTACAPLMAAAPAPPWA